MQGVNLLYVTYGAVALYVVRREITPEMRACPKGPFAIMALLDCLGGLLAALGAAGTPGQLQTLLNQSLAPCAGRVAESRRSALGYRLRGKRTAAARLDAWAVRGARKHA